MNAALIGGFDEESIALAFINETDCGDSATVDVFVVAFDKQSATEAFFERADEKMSYGMAATAIDEVFDDSLDGFDRTGVVALNDEVFGGDDIIWRGGVWRKGRQARLRSKKAERTFDKLNE